MKQIHARAQGMFVFCRDYLAEEDSADFEIGEAYRFVFLVLRGPSAFLEAFEKGELSLDNVAINDVYVRFQRELPLGPPRLMAEEEEIINRHNREVELLKNKRQQQLQQRQRQSYDQQQRRRYR